MAETMYATLFFMCSLPKSDLLKEIRLKHFFFAASRTKDCNSIRALWYSVSKNNVFFSGFESIVVTNSKNLVAGNAVGSRQGTAVKLLILVRFFGDLVF